MLLLMKNGSVVASVFEGKWVRLPNGTAFSPAVAGWTDGEYSLVEEPEPTPPSQEDVLAQARANMSLSFAQLLYGLVAENWITAPEGTAWLVDRTLPAPVEALIASLPSTQQLLARARALQPTEISRNDPMVAALGSAQGKTPAELDTFFMTYAQV